MTVHGPKIDRLLESVLLCWENGKRYSLVASKGVEIKHVYIYLGRWRYEINCFAEVKHRRGWLDGHGRLM